MTEVTVLHVVAEADEVGLTSSSKVVDIIAEKEKENKQENLSNGANAKTAKEGSGSDGSDVDVNRNDVIDGVPEESNSEKNDNCIGEEDGEVKSESYLVEDEYSIGTGDHEEEPIELCHGESPIDEQNSRDVVGGDPVSAINSEDGVPEESNSEKNDNCIGEEGEEVKSESYLVEDEYSIGTGDQEEEEPVELCHGKSPVDEQNSRDVVEGDPVSAINSEDGVSESPEDVVESSDVVEIGPSVEGGKSSNIIENGSSTVVDEKLTVGSNHNSQKGDKSSLLNENVTAETDTGAFVLVFGSFSVSVGSKSGVTAETSLNSYDDQKIETEIIKSDEGIWSLISEKDISSASIVSEEVEDTSDASISNPDGEQICGLTNGGIQSADGKMPFNYIIKVPRYSDENLKENIRLAQINVDDKTRRRDAIRIEMQSMRATCKEYGNDFNAAVSQEQKARDLHRSKRQEIESLQSLMDIDLKIRNMKHTIQHETLPLRDEKNFIREIKKLEQTREKFSSTMGRQDEIRQGLDRKDRLKSLKKEAEQLKCNDLKAEAVTKAAKRKYHDEFEKFNKLQSRFKAADDIQQEAYAQLRALKKRSYEKSKYFWQYRDDLNTANDLASKGGKETLQSFCTNQVEKFMDLWNNNDEFRKEYVRCNARSTIRRLGTLDGRTLGPDEKPPVIPQVVNETVAKDAVPGLTLEDQAQVMLAKVEKEIDKHVPKETRESGTGMPVKSVPPAAASSRDKMEEAGEEKLKRRKEDEEAAKLREQLRLEEIAKAKEALERKRRKAEKAQARDAERAMKEAEKKEKEREKRAKKKERRRATKATNDTTSNASEAPETLVETLVETRESTNKEDKAMAVSKMLEKHSQFAKQTKAKSIPPPPRNQRNRRMHAWIWIIFTSLIMFALFFSKRFFSS